MEALGFGRNEVSNATCDVAARHERVCTILNFRAMMNHLRESSLFSYRRRERMRDEDEANKGFQALNRQMSEFEIRRIICL